MNNNHITKILFCATIAVICVSDCGNVKRQQQTDANTEALEVMLDSLNLSDSTPATIKNIDSRLVNAEGEEWVWSYGTDSMFYVFRADGVCKYRSFIVGEEPFASENKWFTNGNKITIISVADGEEYESTFLYAVSDNIIKIGDDSYMKQRQY